MTSISSSHLVEPRSSSHRVEPENIGAWLRIVLTLLTLVVVGLYGADVHGTARAVLSLLFISTVPGAAIMSHARPLDAITVAAMSIALSLAVCAVMSTVAAWLHIYSPGIMLGTVAVASLVLLFARSKDTEVAVPSGGTRWRHNRVELRDSETPPGPAS